MILTTEGIKRSFPVGGGERQVLRGIGRLACESLLRRIRGEAGEQARYVPYRLVEREADIW